MSGYDISDVGICLCVAAIHSKYLVAMLHLLVALARFYRAPVRFPENVSVRVTAVQVSSKTFSEWLLPLKT